MAAKHTKLYRVGSLDASFQQVPLVRISEIFTLLLNISEENKKKIIYFWIKKFPEIQFTIEIAYFNVSIHHLKILSALFERFTARSTFKRKTTRKKKLFETDYSSS